LALNCLSNVRLNVWGRSCARETKTTLRAR
jgi:hypothetical protein